MTKIKNESQDDYIKSKGWIGVDLDGTLAHYEGWKGGIIGLPIQPMVDRIKVWLAEGREVRIFTARVSPLIYKIIQEAGGENSLEISDDLAKNIVQQIEWIKEFCLLNIGVELPITCVKDFHMIELWDDRCVRVLSNTGERCCNGE